MPFLRATSRFCLGLAAIGACWLAWWVVYRDSRARVDATETKPPAAAMRVHVMPARSMTIQDRIDLVGSLEAKNAVEVRARVSGYITTLPFDVGEAVPAGRNVVILDDTDFQERVNSAQAALEVARAELSSRQAERDVSQRNLEREQDLQRDGAGTEKALEAAEGAVEIADAQVKLYEARVAEAESIHRQSELALADLQIASPIEGVVGRRFLDIGNLAQPEVPLMLIVDNSAVRTRVHVVEKDYPRVSVDQEAFVRVDAHPDQVFCGKVKRIAPVVDPETRTAAVEIEIPNPDRLLNPGMHARVSIVYESHQGNSVVPIEALVDSKAGQSVFVVVGDPPHVEERLVTVGMNDGDLVEVLAGVEEDEQVVTLGNRLVRNGQEVDPQLVDWPVSVEAPQTASVDDDAGLTPSQ